MAFTSVMTTETDFDAKAGAGVSSSYTEAMKNAAVLRAESIVNATASKNYSDTYAALNGDVKYLMSDIVSSFVAIEAISYDMGGYTSIREAENMINVLRDGMLRNLALLRQKKTVDFINGA